ncbi:MAG: pseudouridine synthase, partial [Phycisphaerae bacterium]
MADVQGILNLNKSAGITSAKALYAVRKIVGQRKSGHAGTLDPAATGVLVLCLGRATKLTERLMDQPKVYRARARLDVTSESFDSDRRLI